MNYLSTYTKLIQKRRDFPLSYVRGKTPGHERHHAKPRCQGGSDDSSNIVVLTAREHFIAHILLSKIYPRDIGLLAAAVRFKVKNKRLRRITKVNSRIYAMLKRDWHNFLVNSVWVYNLKTLKRRRIWKDDPIPGGFAAGMGPCSKAFMTAMNNRAKKSHPIVFNGQTYSIKDVSEKFGIPKNVILWRIKHGWSAEQIVMTPYERKRNSFSQEDEAELRQLFEEWKTESTAELIRRHPAIFNGRHGKITAIRIVGLFAKYIPEYHEYNARHRKDHISARVFYEFQGKRRSVKEISGLTGISSEIIENRLMLGWDIIRAATQPVIKPGANFADTEETLAAKKTEAAEMFEVFTAAGKGFAGVAAVNAKFNTDFCYDSLVRRFRKFRFDYRAPVVRIKYKGKDMTLLEISKATGLPKYVVYDRLVRRHIQDTGLTIEEALASELPTSRKGRK